MRGLFDGDDSLDKARRHVLANLVKGSTCPCCSKWAQVYWRTIHADVGKFLIYLYRAMLMEKGPGFQRWVHIRDLPGQTGNKASTDAAYMVHWGLVRKKDDNDMGKKGGFYILTDLGVRFVLDNERVPRRKRIYANRVTETDETPISISEAVNEKFNYRDLMAGR